MDRSVLLNAVEQVIETREAQAKHTEYKRNPELWAKDVLGTHLWSKQREIAESVCNNQRTAVRSCNNAGKTAIAGMIAAWWIGVNDPHDTIVVITAPGFSQIKTNMFHELQTNIRRAKDNGTPLPGKINIGQNLAEWKLPDGTQMAIGRRPPDNDVVTAFQGIHRKNVLVIIDEAGGVPADIYNLAERITTTGNTRILAIGNPDRIGSEFHKTFSKDSDWNTIHISGYDTPNFTDEEFPDSLREYMLQPEWVARQKRVWGENDPRYKISILGEFPDSDDTIFFPQSIIDKAVDTEIEEDLDILPELGVDLARMGADNSVIYSNRGGRLRKEASWGKANAIESAQKVHTKALELGARIVKVDSGGIGGPIIDILSTMAGESYKIVGMAGSAAPTDPRRWLNMRAQWHDNLRTMMAEGRVDLDPGDEDLATDMGDINFDFTERGALKIESKKDLRDRTGKSPDNLDAAIYAMVDVSELVDDPLKSLPKGSQIELEMEQFQESWMTISPW